MISIISTNITSPLGFTTEENYQAVCAGRSSLRSGADGTAMRSYGGCLPQKEGGSCGLLEPFAASLFSEEQLAALSIDGYTRFESLAIHSVREALSHTQLDVTSPKVVLILSTTKGNIGQSPSEAVQAIAKAIGLVTMPIVVCNACVSGLSAQLLADHLISASLYDHAIVVGAEVQTEFIVSGFQSLKAVSEEPCRPFDIERNGLNPGEAAATIIFSPLPASPKGEVPSPATQVSPAGGDLEGAWHLMNGAVCNDAFHISSPSPQANGLTAAIEAVMEGWSSSQLASICVHGTATLYNDQMESKAIQRAGLSDVPLSALKGYYGHTMGAAGVLETILTMRATDDGIVLASKGFTELGVSGKVCISNESKSTNKTSFLKLISGFGGCNVAALYSKEPLSNARREAGESTSLRRSSGLWSKTQTVRISSEDGKSLTEIYKQQIGDYPKFHKMDILSRLAFVAAELLKPSSNSPTMESLAPEVGSIILFNHSSSIVQDRQYLSTISDADNFFPSPSAFVYTLPNIAAGEIAIRHHLCGETSFYILPEKNDALMQQILDVSLRSTNTTSVISGWVDAESEMTFECELSLYMRFAK